VSETFDYLRMFGSFPFALRRFLQTAPLTLEAARRIVRQRLAQREANFLKLAERSMYGWPRSPYLALLKHAGCELGDLQAMTRDHGLEGTLRKLREAGVYVTFEEFKGRQPVERPGLTLPVTAEDFDNPFAERQFNLRTGGSTGKASVVGLDLNHIAAGAPAEMLSMAAHDLLDAPVIDWLQGLPGPSPRSILRRAYFGQVAERWLCPTGWHDSRYWFKYDLAMFYMLACMRLRGVKVAWPEYMRAGHDQALEVARLVYDKVQAHGRCLLNAGVSRAIRLSLAAQAAGINLTGATVRSGGEAATPAKVEIIRRSGLRFISQYNMMETSTMAFGCARSSYGSDVHLFRDSLALITHPYLVENVGITVPAFNLTTLEAASPKLMLNTQIDDYGVVEERDCGCALGDIGYTTHLRDIRSYSKLTGEGVTLIGNELQRILEETLPARFGGSLLDYQFQEQEDAQGLTRLYLAISPRLNIADEGEVVAVVLESLGKSSPMADAARAIWQRAQSIRVRRAEPVRSSRGKVLPLHMQARPSASERPGS
jgi:hypothetical protein